MEVTTLDSRTFGMALLQTLIKPFRPHLAKSRKVCPAGSPRLTVPRSVHKKCSVIERRVNDIFIYDFRAKIHSGIKPNARLYYFAGGGWQMPPSSQHYHMLAELSHRLPHTLVCLISYPLAPACPAAVTFPALLALYRTLLSADARAGRRVIVGCDSAGGNLALSLTLETLRELDAEKEALVAPAALLLISPACDLTNTNPAMAEVDKRDPILTAAYTDHTARTWAGEWDRADRRLSPVNYCEDVALLARAGVKIIGVTGGADVLAPDALRFRDMCVKADVCGRWLHWERQVHCFPLTWSYGLREGKDAVEWFVRALQELDAHVE